jgi:hypothetical protein
MNFHKADMDGSFERESNNNNRSYGTQTEYTIDIVDGNMNVHWSCKIINARGPKHARDLWRVKYPEIRKQFIGKGYMIRVR